MNQAYFRGRSDALVRFKLGGGYWDGVKNRAQSLLPLHNPHALPGSPEAQEYEKKKNNQEEMAHMMFHTMGV